MFSRGLIYHLFPVFFFLCFLSSLEAQIFYGEVVKVVDGDTIHVMSRNTKMKVRLYGIDTPEKGQPYGDQAALLVSDLSLGAEVMVDVLDIDRYDRFVGIVKLGDGRILNHELVEAGLAWWYKQYAPGDTVLRDLEAEARSGERGIWSRKDAVPPWDWRRGIRSPAEKRLNRSGAVPDLPEAA